MKNTQILQEIRKTRCMEAYEGQDRRLSQKEAAVILGVHERTFRRYIARYEESGEDGLYDKRLTQRSHRATPVDEVIKMIEKYRSRYYGWNVKHYYSFYHKQGGCRSYSWVKDHLQAHGLVRKSKGRGKHRKRRKRSPLPGMMIHQEAVPISGYPESIGI